MGSREVLRWRRLELRKSKEFTRFETWIHRSFEPHEWTGNNRELQIMRKLVLSGLAALLVALLSGCATYYKVSDPNSSNVYYTTDIDKEKSGAISFTDAKSKAKVTLQSSAITEISSDEWDKAVGE